MQSKTIAMVLLVAITTIGTTGIEIGTTTQSVQGQNTCISNGFDHDDSHGQSFHDCNCDLHGHTFTHP